ncbi:MAG TPA: serine/threonine-protein kinase [Kofleriaceae bacterium]|nr:serine/threonine-protein kinase [Kofleriaceae bacterium]
MGSSERNVTQTGETIVEKRAHAERGESERGREIGRYVVVERVGAGGMGIVYKAYDPELDRAVAIKVLARAASRGRERLLREAQALARLSHPHVIAVHDVGTVGDEVFLAMELVQGPTLEAWLAEQPRTKKEILEAFIAAGEGIAAAHAVGLVHRDVKPSNIMIGADGRVRVLDFGVARAAGDAPDTPVPGATGDTTGRTSKLAEPLTRAGAVVGTPRYMSPEQYQQREVDARSDQFGFCVALWEALAGEHPFKSESRDALRLKVLTGVLPPAKGQLTRRLRQILARGLSVDPADRWPSMDALLAALRRDPVRDARRAAIAVVGIGAIAGAVAVSASRAPAPPCRSARAHVAQIWATPQKAALVDAFAKTGAPFAADASRRTIASLDRWTDAWVAMHTDACEATQVRGEQSAELMDLRIACLERRRARAAATIDVLVHADREVVARAGDLVDDLPTLAECADPEALRRTTTPRDPAAQAALARAQALDGAGKNKEAAAAAGAAMTAHDPATRAEARIVLARVKSALGADAEVGPMLRDAMRDAALAHADAIEARAWIDFVHQVGDLQSHYDQVEPWLGEVGAMVSRTGDAALAADLDFTLGAMAWRRGRYDDALAAAHRALDAYTKLYGAGDRRTMRAIWVIANVTDERGDHAAAVPLYRKILDVDRAELGDRHPTTAQDYINLGTAFGSSGDEAAALDNYERGRAILEESSPGSGELSSVLINIGTVHTRQGRHQRALASYERARAMVEQAMGPRHPDVAHVLLNEAESLRALGRDRDAEAALDRTLSIWHETYGADHPYLAYAEAELAITLEDDHQPKDALAHARKALAIAQAQLGAEHELVSHVVSVIGEALVETGHADEGFASLKRAVALADKVGGPRSTHLGYALVALGRMQLDHGDPAGARATLERAVAVCDAAGEPPLAAEADLLLARALPPTDPRARPLAQKAHTLLDVDGAGPTTLLAQADAFLRSP